jgi:hypothetical protein
VLNGHLLEDELCLLCRPPRPSEPEFGSRVLWAATQSLESWVAGKSSVVALTLRWSRLWQTRDHSGALVEVRATDCRDPERSRHQTLKKEVSLYQRLKKEVAEKKQLYNLS